METHPDLLTLTVTRINQAARDALLVYLEAENQQRVDYDAGQFLTFVLVHYGLPVRRSYSLVTTPGVDAELAIVIKRRANGEISRYLIDHLKVGDRLTALPPSGRFTIATAAANERTIFFIAAGSGISPLYALLKKLLYREPRSRAILIYQNHDESSIIFLHELAQLQQQFADRFICLHLLSEPNAKNLAPQRLNNFLLEQLVILHQGRNMHNEFYLCGPGSFMRMAQFVLKLMGFALSDIHKENFVIDSVPPPRLQLDASPKQILLKWKHKNFRFTATYPESILQAALNHHIHLPYSCRGGRCSTCTLRCVSGSVKMSINEVLTDRDLADGLVLSCVGYAETDLELEV